MMIKMSQIPIGARDLKATNKLPLHVKDRKF
jgi:hypothetical protein